MDYIYEKELLLRTILENTKAQTQAIEVDDLETLETLIGQRAKMMQQVDKLDQQVVVAPRRALTESKSILTQVITIDNANRQLMEKDIENIGKDVENVKMELRDIRERKRQGELYVPEYGTYREEGVFFDTKE